MRLYVFSSGHKNRQWHTVLQYDILNAPGSTMQYRTLSSIQNKYCSSYSTGDLNTVQILNSIIARIFCEDYSSLLYYHRVLYSSARQVSTTFLHYGTSTTLLCDTVQPQTRVIVSGHLSDMLRSSNFRTQMIDSILSLLCYLRPCKILFGFKYSSLQLRE